MRRLLSILNFPIIIVVLYYIITGVISINLFAQSQKEQDPILRRSWIPTVREKEIRSFHKIQSDLNSKPNFVVQSDRWGRGFKLKRNGEIEYLLDSTYRKKFPDSENTILAYYEALSLEISRYTKEALHLLEGIQFCYNLKNPGKEVTDWEFKVNLLANRIRQKHKTEFILSIDPHGCYHYGMLHLRSDRFHYHIQLPKTLNYEYSNTPEEISSNTKEYESRYVRLFQMLDVKEDRTWEDELFLSEIGEERFRKDKAIFFIGALKENQPIFNRDNFYRIWDQIRGLQPSTKREWKYSRKEKSPGYELLVSILNEKGESEPWTIREFYYWKDGQGIFLSFSFPNKESENMEKDWMKIISSFKVRP